MGRYVLHRRVGSPPDEVFARYTDPVVMADWMDSDAVTDLTGPLTVAGTSFTLVVFPLWRFRMRVIRSEAPTRHEIDGTAPLGARVRMLLTLTERDGGTDLELDTAYTVPLGPIGRWIDRRWIEPGPKATAQREFDRFVTIAEGAPAFAARRDRPD